MYSETIAHNGPIVQDAAANDNSSRSDSSHHGRFLPGTKIADRYRIVSLAGKGGMGEVYRADDLKLGHTVALKFLPKDLAEDPQLLEYFHSEVRLTRQISHPNICTVYDIGEVDDHHFLSMEYIDGENLKVLLRRIGRLPKDKGIEIAQQLCAGLAAAHEKGVIHRDLKPANIMIDGRGHVRITDFGLAKPVDEAHSGEISGTPAYMAPEQLERGEATVQSDLYSLGLILYELFTGERVYKTNSIPELRETHKESSITQPSSHVDNMDPMVERVILRCLEKDPAQRPKSARAVAAALPGGDPLAAALAAGETPSPEMIAVAGTEGRMSLAVGTGLMAVIVLVVAAMPFLVDSLGLLHLERHREFQENEPAVLKSNARRWIRDLGHAGPAKDHVFGFTVDQENNNHFEFWYRQNPQSITPHLPFLASRPTDWKTTLTNPSPLTPGMVSLRLDPNKSFESGEQLLEFLAVPEIGELKKSDTQPDWEVLFQQVGLKQQDFVEVTSQEEQPTDWQPPTYVDFVTVWRKNKPAEVLSHVVLATRGGRLVYFHKMQNPSTGILALVNDAARSELIPWRTSRMMVVMVGFCIVLALRNLRRGRSDTRGALRCAIYYFAIDTLMWIVVDHHVAEQDREFIFAGNYLIRSLAFALRVWLYYIALEPYVRRFWPDVLIAWSRLLSGRLRDPLVGRDLMAGCLFGGVWSGLALIAIAYKVNWKLIEPDSLLGGQVVLAEVLKCHQTALMRGIFFLAVFLAMRVLFRRTWIAVIGFTLYSIYTFGSETPSMVETVFFAAYGLTFALFIMRFGLVAAIAAVFTKELLLTVPLTAEFSQWYAQAGMFALAAVLVVAGYGFYTSTLAGRNLIADEL